MISLVLIDLKNGELLLATDPTIDEDVEIEGNFTSGNPMEYIGDL